MSVLERIDWRVSRCFPHVQPGFVLHPFGVLHETDQPLVHNFFVFFFLKIAGLFLFYFIFNFDVSLFFSLKFRLK